jgi:hypothetical protein
MVVASLVLSGAARVICLAGVCLWLFLSEFKVGRGKNLL